MDNKQLTQIVNELILKIKELESRIEKLERTQQPQHYSTETPDLIGKI
ncbi:hypothetical protein ACP0SG_01790 [Campylobacter lari]